MYRAYNMIIITQSSVLCLVSRGHHNSLTFVVADHGQPEDRVQLEVVRADQESVVTSIHSEGENDPRVKCNMIYQIFSHTIRL